MFFLRTFSSSRNALAFASVLASLNPSIAATDHAQQAKKWHYLDVSLPKPLSDMSTNLMELSPASPSAGAMTSVVLAGGCDSPSGNVFHEENFGNETHPYVVDLYDCFSISKKVYAFEPRCIDGSDDSEGKTWDGSTGFDDATDSWWGGSFRELTDMPRERARHAGVVATIGKKLFLVGGRDGNDELIKEIDMYDPILNEWTTAGELPPSYLRSDCAAFVVDDNTIHIVGGYDAEYIAQKTVIIVHVNEVDGTVKDVSDGPDLVKERGDVNAARSSDGNSYFVSGGFTHSNEFCLPHDSVEKYDVSTGLWSEIDALEEERGEKQLVTLNGRLYAIGGETKVDLCGKSEAELPHRGDRSTISSTVEVYDPDSSVSSSSWEPISSLPSPIFRFGASEFDKADANLLFLFGGQVSWGADCDCFRTSKSVLMYREGPDKCVKEGYDSDGDTSAAGPSTYTHHGVGGNVLLRTIALATSTSFIFCVLFGEKL